MGANELAMWMLIATYVIIWIGLSAAVCRVATVHKRQNSTWATFLIMLPWPIWAVYWFVVDHLNPKP